MTNLRSITLALLSLVSAACGGSKPPPADATSDPPPVTSASSESAAPAVEGPKDADKTDPADLPTLTADEVNALDGQCKPFVEAVAKAAKTAKVPKGAWESEQMLAALEKPPKVKGVDEAKCTDIVRRDQAKKRAKMAENDARMMLGTMHDMLGAAFKDTKKLCPGAEATPASIDETKALGGLATKQADWSKGWSCLKFELWNQPARWQYELKSNPGGGTFEIVARGFPVVGGSQVELFLPGIVDAEGVAPKGTVKRR
jgi:hypothetical protein